MTAKKFGYYDASATRLVSAGLRDTVVLTLSPRPTVHWSGKVRDAVSDAGLLDAEVHLEYTGIHDHSDTTGTYDFGAVPQDVYAVGVHRPGYDPIDAVMNVGPGYLGEDFRLDNVRARIAERGDLWKPLLAARGRTNLATYIG